MLNCDNGTYDAWYWAHPPAYMPNNCNLEYVEHIKKYVDIPVVCAGKMEVDVAAKAISENKIDAMGVARQFLTDPKWVTKLIEDKEETIRPCIHCHNACFNMAHYNGVGNDQTLSDNAGMARCALNPQTMQSKKYKIVPTDITKKIAIIGGGIGGMEAARVLKLRGHNPVIFEKTDSLGGVFVAAASPDFKEADKRLIEWYKNEINRLEIEVKFNTEIKDEKELEDYDNIIVATGAVPKKFKLEGIENTIEACEYLENKKQVGKKVVVVGGGLSGCEIALDLHHKGHIPVIVEMKNDLIAQKGVCLANSSYLREYFKLNKVEVHLETSVSKIEKDSVIIKDKDGKEQKIDTDSVIMAVGYNPNPLFEESGRVLLVGDCKSVGNLRSVIWGAWDIAMKI
jgi:2-enoate reductase